MKRTRQELELAMREVQSKMGEFYDKIGTREELTAEELAQEAKFNREVENLDVPAWAHFERNAREILFGRARKLLKENLAFDGTVKGQPEFDRLLFAAERLPQRFAA